MKHNLVRAAGAVIATLVLCAMTLFASSGSALADTTGTVSASHSAPSGVAANATAEAVRGPSAQTAVCVGPYILDQYAQYYDCNVITTTTFQASCSDGRTGQLTVQPGRWYITVDCYPAYITNFTVLP